MDAASLVCCLDAATPDVEATETPIKFGLQHFVLSAIHREIPSLEESEIPSLNVHRSIRSLGHSQGVWPGE